MGDRTIATAPTEALTADELAPGVLFADRYEVRAMLGQGGMGAVHRVLDQELGEEIALKVLKPEVAAVEGALERFRREVKLARRVTHVNVARTYDLGSFAGVRYLTMELIAGEPLSHRVRAARLPLGEALRIIAEIARGLAAAHAAGVVHRDLKPDNVMLAGQRVAITDFGIARLAEGTEHNRTVGVALGTPAYMAPEQVEGRDLDGRADVYALGIVLHELLTGRLPFTGDTPWALAAARLEDRPIDPRALEPNVPANVAELVIAALARRREQRLDAAQFVARLDAIRGQVAEPAYVTPARGGERSMVTPSVRTVGLSPLSGNEALARDIATALATALAKVRGVQVLMGERGDLSLVGSARVSGARARVGVSLVDSATGAQVWAEDFNGTLEDPFALEDAVSTGVVAAVRARASRDTGPANDTVRNTLTRARELMRWYTHDNLKRAIDMLRAAHADTPDDPHIMSVLGAALVRASRNAGGTDPSLLAEAEEMTLRALALDPTNGETFLTIGTLRASKGELRAAVRAFEEATQRSPRLAEPHAWLGRLLFESGRVDEGERRIEHALKLDPESVQAIGERIRIWGLTGRHEKAVATVEAMPSLGSVYLRSRLAFWHRDRALAASTAQIIADNPESSGELTLRYFAPVLLGIVAGDVPTEPARACAAAMARGRASGSMQAVTLDLLLVAGLHEEALELLAANATELLDLGWMDHCPLTEPIRDDARFGVARAVMAGRAAELWK